MKLAPALVLASSMLLASLGAGCATPKGSDGEPISFRDAKDGQFDVSKFLASRSGFLPLPILITEPAVGYGAGLGVMFLHDKLGREPGEERKGPPSITAVAGAYTESDSWGGGIGHFGSW